MPYIKNNTFKPTLLLRNGEVNTIYRFLLSKEKVIFKRERLETKDGDFLDLDTATVHSKIAVIIIHGLEGDSNSTYIHTVARSLNEASFDAIAFNMRGCSGEPNRYLNSYHGGNTADLLEVVNHIKNSNKYNQIHIVGFSLSGNITLKFMGEFANDMPDIIKSAVAISTPCDLEGSSDAISSLRIKYYMNDFLKTMKVKALEKIERFPEANLDKEKILSAKDFVAFDDAFSAPTNGFKDAQDYWSKSSSKQFIQFINKPTLLISSKDDPFLSDSCMPIEEAKNHKHFTFVMTNYGGHIGFILGLNIKKQKWMENQIVDFISKNS